MVQSNRYHSHNTKVANLAIPVIILGKKKKANTMKEFFVFQKHESNAVCQCHTVCPSVSETLSCCARACNPLSIRRESRGTVLRGSLLFRKRGDAYTISHRECIRDKMFQGMIPVHRHLNWILSVIPFQLKNTYETAPLWLLLFWESSTIPIMFLTSCCYEDLTPFTTRLSPPLLLSHTCVHPGPRCCSLPAVILFLPLHEASWSSFHFLHWLLTLEICCFYSVDVTFTKISADTLILKLSESSASQRHFAVLTSPFLLERFASFGFQATVSWLPSQLPDASFPRYCSSSQPPK